MGPLSYHPNRQPASRAAQSNSSQSEWPQAAEEALGAKDIASKSPEHHASLPSSSHAIGSSSPAPTADISALLDVGLGFLSLPGNSQESAVTQQET